MKQLYFFGILLSFLIFISCVYNKEQIHTNPTEPFKQVVELTGEPIGPENKFLRTRKVMLIDTFLVVVDSKASPYSIFLINLKDNGKLHRIAHRGQGPTEFLQAWDIALDMQNPRAFWVIDPNARRFSYFILDSILQGRISPLRRVSAKSHKLRPEDFFVTDSHIVSTGLINRKQLAFFSIDDGSLIRESSKIPVYVDYPKNVTDDNLSLAYRGVIGVSPNQEWIAAGSGYADYLSIYSPKGILQKTIRTKENLEPEFVVDKNGRIGFTEKNRYGYLDVVCTNDLIFALYSGKTHKGDIGYTGKNVYVYNWEGEPICHLVLDRYVRGICVDEKSGLLYALEIFADKPILRYKLPESFKQPNA